MPYDPHLPSLFDGEEYSKYARLWTRYVKSINERVNSISVDRPLTIHAPTNTCPHRGYDTYTPHRNIVYHDYKHGADTKDANSWSRKYRELQRSHDRLRTLLGMPGATVARDSPEAAKLLGRWDLGKKRSLNQLIAFSGVDTRALKTDFDNCGKLQWVPFDEGDDDDQYLEEESARREQREADPVAEAAKRLKKAGVGGGAGSRTLRAAGKGAARRAVGSSAAAGASVHALSDRLPISEEGAGRVLAGMCLLGFFVLIGACLVATPLTRRQNLSLAQQLGLPMKSVTKRV